MTPNVNFKLDIEETVDFFISTFSPVIIKPDCTQIQISGVQLDRVANIFYQSGEEFILIDFTRNSSQITINKTELNKIPENTSFFLLLKSGSSGAWSPAGPFLKIPHGHNIIENREESIEPES